MFIPFTLLFYIARIFLKHLFVVTLSIGLLCFLTAFAETGRRLIAQGIDSISIMIKVASFQIPMLIEIVFPFIFLISAMSCFFSLTRNHELDAAHTGGVSALMFISPALIIALISGVLIFSVYNPISAVLITKHNEFITVYVKKKPGLLMLSLNGIWLRQGDDQKQSIIHATQADSQGANFSNVSIFLYEEQNQFIGRLDAEQAILEKGKWDLRNVWITPSDGASRFVQQHEEPTTLTPEHVYDSAAPPNTIAFWNLRRFIHLAKAAGLSVPSYEFQWYMLIAMPVFLFAMVLFGASMSFFFSLRRNSETKLVIVSILFGFVIYTLIFLARKLALSSDVSVMFVALAPIALALSSGFILFLQKEAG